MLRGKKYWKLFDVINPIPLYRYFGSYSVVKFGYRAKVRMQELAGF